MATAKDDLIKAFHEAAAREFAFIPPEDEIDYTFSARFLKKMDALIEKAEYKRTHKISKAAKKILIAAAVFILLLAGMMSVGAVREAVVKIIHEKFDGYYDITFEGDTTDKIGYAYSLQPIPEGFEVTVYTADEGSIYAEYSNSGTGDIIIFSQVVTDGSQPSIDSENGKISTFLLDGLQIYIYKKNNTENYTIAYWTKDAYFFNLVYYGKISAEEMLELIKTIH